jgi:hypothetical protein
VILQPLSNSEQNFSPRGATDIPVILQASTLCKTFRPAHSSFLVTQGTQTLTIILLPVLIWILSLFKSNRSICNPSGINFCEQNYFSPAHSSLIVTQGTSNRHCLSEASWRNNGAQTNFQFWISTHWEIYNLMNLILTLLQGL